MDKNLLKENRIHGNTTYPVSVYTMQCNKHILDCHWHEEMELLLVTGGKAVFQVAASYYEVYEGQALFINSGELHAGYPLEESFCNYEALVFHPDFLCSNEFDIVREKYILPIMDRRLSLPVHIKGNNPWEKDILKLIAQSLEQNHGKSYAYELTTKANISLLLSSILINCAPAPGDKTARENNYKVERLKTVLHYIHTNYHEKITLPQLSGLINMSNEHFCRFFKQMLRRTPIDYLNYYRIKKAANLLESSTGKISRIASDVGFDNISYFVSLFRHYMMCTPSKYRKMAEASKNSMTNNR